MKDPVSPPHYQQHPSGVECIQITRHMNFNLGNVLKYIWRADHKEAQLQDLKKAQWYLADEIARLEKAPRKYPNWVVRLTAKLAAAVARFKEKL